MRTHGQGDHSRRGPATAIDDRDKGAAVADGSTPIAQDSMGLRRSQKILLQIGVLVAGLAIWEVVAVATNRQDALGQPSVFIPGFFASLFSGDLIYHSAITASEMLAGLVLGAVAGVVIGLSLIVAPPRIKKVVNFYVVGFYCLPKIAIVPLFILWFGIGWESKVYFVSMISFFFMFLAVHEGSKHPPTDQLNQALIMGATRLQLIRFVYAPHALRWVIGGLKMTIPYSLTYAVSAELIASRGGVGNIILRAAGAADMNRILEALAAVLVLAGVLHFTGLSVERRVRT
jgi:NitT/TauT family transport system permease protein